MTEAPGPAAPDEADEADGTTRTGADALLEVRDLEKYYYENDTIVDRLLGRERGAVRAVDGVSLTVHEGETLGLVGESGCGKSTTGETLLALEEATDGEVYFDGDRVFEMDGDELDRFRRRAQVVFQDPFSSLDPRMTAGEIVTEPLTIHDRPATDPAVETRAEVTVRGGLDPDLVDVTVADDVDRVVDPEDGVATVHVTVEDRGEGVHAETDADLRCRVSVETGDTGERHVDVRVVVGRSVKALRRERAMDLLERVGLSADQVDRYPHEFSGGQRQRIGVARALALEPEFLVLDEPVSALDVSVQAQILNLLEDLQAEYGFTYLFIAHDLSVVRHISDRVAVMYLGEVVERGPVEAIFEDPSHPYTEALLQSVPRADTAEKGRRVDPLAGDVPSPRNPPEGCRFHTRCPYAREACREESPGDYETDVPGQQAACFRVLEDHPYWESEPLEGQSTEIDVGSAPGGSGESDGAESDD